MISFKKIFKSNSQISTTELATLSNALFKIFFFIFILALAILTIQKSNYYRRNYQNLVTSSVNHNINFLTAWLSQQRQLIYNLAQSDAIVNYLQDPSNLENAKNAHYRLTNLKSFSPSFTNALVIVNTQTLAQHTQSIAPYAAVDHRGNQFSLEGTLSLLMDTSLPPLTTFFSGANLDTLSYAPFIQKGDKNFFIGKLEVTTVRTSFPLVQLIHNANAELLGAIVFNVDLATFLSNSNAISLGESGRSFITDGNAAFVSPQIQTNELIYDVKLEPLKRWLHQNIHAVNIDNHQSSLQHLWIEERSYVFYARVLSYFQTIDEPIYIVFMQEFEEAFKPAFLDFLWSDFILLIIFAMGGGLVIFFLYEQYRRSFDMEKLYNQKKYNDLIQLSLVDGLTGLFNRTFFRQNRDEMEKFEGNIGIIVIDVDGLKIINDTFGHEQGDALIRMCSKIIKGSLPKMKISRIGGDEFMAFLPDHNRSQVEQLVKRLKENIALINHQGHTLPLPISFSIGWASLQGPYVTNELFREADALLYNQKSEQSLKLRARILKHFSRMLVKADPTTTNHYLEILRIAHSIAQKIHDTENIDFNALHLLVRYHNIGLISYDKDAQVLSNHIQTGYRIALYLPKLTPIARLILTHEEIYCGTGPLNFKAKEIPIECRILTVALLFISRYHGSCNQNSALTLNSIKRDSGRLFDPQLVDILTEIVNIDYQSYLSASEA